MLLHDTTHQYQSALANYCRSGKQSLIPGINADNIGQYRRLVFNVIDEMLKSAYPLSSGLLLPEEWLALINDFFSHHSCQSPQVWYMPKEFYEYLLSNTPEICKKYPYLQELLWLEWLEVKVFMMEDIPVDYYKTGNPEHDELVLNPEIHFQHFHYPVHWKKADHISIADYSDYYLSVHRLPESGEVIFTDLSPAFVRFLELMGQRSGTLTILTLQLCEEFQLRFTEEILNQCKGFVEMALSSQLIIGFKPH